MVAFKLHVMNVLAYGMNILSYPPRWALMDVIHRGRTILADPPGGLGEKGYFHKLLQNVLFCMRYWSGKNILTSPEPQDPWYFPVNCEIRRKIV